MTSEPNDERVPDFFHSGSLKLLGNSKREVKLIEAGVTEDASSENKEVFEDKLQEVG